MLTLKVGLETQAHENLRIRYSYLKVNISILDIPHVILRKVVKYLKNSV